MTKKVLNQNTKYEQELINSFEPDFSFSDQAINRLNISLNNLSKNNDDKIKELSNLKNQINSIENCNLKKNSKNLILGDGDINSSIMLIGEAPGNEEDETGSAYQGEVGKLLKKMLSAINVDIKKVYLTYALNFRIPEDKKPNTQDIKRYSKFLREHISIINPKIIILMGSTAMEAVTGINDKISNERGKWKEIIFNNVSVPVMITFSPSYLIRYPDNKKYSWEDLKRIREKIKNLEISI